MSGFRILAVRTNKIRILIFLNSDFRVSGSVYYDPKSRLDLGFSLEFRNLIFPRFLNKSLKILRVASPRGGGCDVTQVVLGVKEQKVHL